MTLKEVLGEELFAQVDAKINEVNASQPDKTKHVRFADLSEGGYVSVSKYNDKVNGLTQQVTDLQGQITQRDADLAGLNEQLTAVLDVEQRVGGGDAASGTFFRQFTVRFYFCSAFCHCRFKKYGSPWPATAKLPYHSVN